MKKVKYMKSICGLLIMICMMLTDIQVNAEGESNQNIASAKCVLLDRNTISYEAVLSVIPVNDDGFLYLYEMQPYEYTVSLSAEPVAKAPVSLTPRFTIPFTAARLYQKLGLAIKSGGQNVLIAYPQYITNPEMLAQYTKPRQKRTLKSEQGKDFCNLNLSGNIAGVLAGKYTTAQVMNEGHDQVITNPYSRTSAKSGDSHPVRSRYYMLNASEPAGITAITNELSLCAASSTVENFIIGNEVNTRTWNYMIWTDWDSYVREYVQAFRIAYNAIKSQNANARVFVCIDQVWDRNSSPDTKEYYEVMDSKDFLCIFNRMIASEGNIDWGIAQHPYTAPLTYAKFWDMSGCRNGGYMMEQVSSGKVVTFQNLSLLTDYMQSPEMLSPTGKVRHLILSEIGLTNAQGSDVQAAALYASYIAAKNNPYVEEIIYLLTYSEPRIDTRLSGQAQLVYNSLGTVNETAYDAWAKAFIGISDWSQVIN